MSFLIFNFFQVGDLACILLAILYLFFCSTSLKTAKASGLPGYILLLFSANWNRHYRV